MSPFIYDASVEYRVNQLQAQADKRRMAKAVRAGAVLRGNHPIKDALGNGLIALGERLVDIPPTVEGRSFDTAA